MLRAIVFDFDGVLANSEPLHLQAYQDILAGEGIARAEEIRRVLERENLASCFTAIVAAEDTPISKPAPDPYVRAVQRLSHAIGELAAADCVALEDSRWGLQSARTAGLRTVGVAQTYDRSALVEADLIIETIDSLDLRDLARLCST